jgi:Ca-activated chloride channel family protein
MGAVTWGLASLLWIVEPRIHSQEKVAKKNEIRHLVLVVDVSPSMALADAGPDQKISRRQRASDIVESIFNRIPMHLFRISFIAVYSDAKPLLEDSTDHEVIRHMMEKMPMWHAFKAGKTQLLSGIEMAAKIAKPWNPGSTTVVILTDGDTVPAAGMPAMPASVRNFIVVGVGDVASGRFIDGHLSRQDTNTLRQIANRVRGHYHNGNERQLPSNLVSMLNESYPDTTAQEWTRREWSLIAVLAGSLVLALLPTLLHYFGTSYVAGTDYQKAPNLA